MPHVKKLVNATKEEVDRATWVLVNSIGAQDLPTAGTGFDPSVKWDNFRARIDYGCQDGWVYVVGEEEGGIDGVLQVNPPGWDLGSSKTLGGDVPKYRERLSPEIGGWIQDNLVPALGRHLKNGFDPLNPKDIFYIALLGIDPAKAGKGLGRALIEFALKDADEQNAPSGLFTQLAENVTWYQKFGFEVTLEEDIDLMRTHTLSWGMVRPAPRA